MVGIVLVGCLWSLPVVVGVAAQSGTAEGRRSLPAVVRGEEWLLRDSQTSGNATTRFAYGPGGVPVFGDWDGDVDMVTDLGLVRRRAGGDLVWLLERDYTATGEVDSDGVPDARLSFGRSGDLPVVGRWVMPTCFECVPAANVGVVRRVGDHWVWLLETETQPPVGLPASDGRADITLHYGVARSGDLPIVGDWDGDFVDDVGVVRGNGRWLLETSGGDRTASDGRHDLDWYYGTRTAGDVFLSWRR